MKTDISAYRQIWGQLNQHKVLFGVLCLVSLSGVVSESLGLGVILPFLSTSGSKMGSLSKIPFAASFVHYTDALSMTKKILFAASALAFIFFIRGFFLYEAQRISALLKNRIERNLSSGMFRQIHEVELQYIHSKHSGEFHTLLGPYAFQTGMLIYNVCGSITNIFTVIVYAVLMLIVSWQLALLAIVLQLAVSIFIRKRLSTHIRQAGNDIKESTRELRSFIVESLSGLKLIHLLSRESGTIEKFDEVQKVYFENSFRAKNLVGISRPLYNFLNVLVLSLLLIASTVFLKGPPSAWLPQMSLFLLIAFRLMTPLGALSQTQAMIIQQYPILHSILDFIRTGDKPYLQNGHISFEKLRDRISLQDISFRYRINETRALENISFDIPKGKMTAVVGESGSGKSTLVNLIARLYDCENGRIMVDDTDLRDLDVASWRSRIAVVSQDTFIFNDTVWANLRMARLHATEEEIYRAAQLAEAHGFLKALPQGYNTLLGDRGVRLSGGQQQRIAIARAILADPQILILDEATSELDSETEQEIHSSLARFGQGRTMMAIAHRLSTVRNADNIIVLNAGKLVEQGTHEELMHEHGRYCQMVQVQSSKSVSS
ncbi:MAG TPA: ABC transporter ATP-binding protein [Desulfobacteraceae bacterium]|nr:ABC transporter ATP-binding protein [Desulfobacteraceae bacterium]HPJ66403.1 ABC transporter ATP-binding protein [Desulfobacteraceae bacterium]HPQ27325.1 ABC transporter ATP-binding protein [Desulfobacteraceae bacterium]